MSQIVTGGVGGTLTLEFTAVGFATRGISSLYESNATRGSATSTFTGYFDAGNTPFGHGTTIGTLGPVSGNFNGGLNGPVFPVGPFSITEVVGLTLGPNSSFVSSSYQVSPQPCGGSIGDFVWSDTNFNGIQDAVEAGINGVTVQLYKGSVAPANLVGSTITANAPGAYMPAPAFGPAANAPGYYQFTGLCHGNYIVVADQNLPANQPVLSGFTPSPAFKGGNPALDSSDTDASVTLATETSSDETIDFGFAAAPPPTLVCGAGTGEVGVFYSTSLTATGGFSPYTFSATGLPAWLALTPTSGALTGMPTAPGTLNFTATVVDSRNNAAGTTSQSCPIVMNPPPMLSCSAGASGEVGVLFNSPAPTVTGGVGPFTFSVVGALPAGLSLDSVSGAITGVPTAPGTFSIKVTDSNGQVATGACPFTIVGRPVLTCPAAGATGIVGEPFITPALTVTGGTAPYTFSVIGTLPAGLTLSPLGAISGTPSAGGTFSIKVTDANGVFTVGACPYTVYPAISANCVSITAIQGVAITPVTMTGSGGVGGPYTFTATGLPAGLRISTAGTVSGTPTVSGTFNYTMTVKDAAGNTGSIGCSVVVAPPPPPLDLQCGACGSITANVGVPYSGGLQLTGGSGPFTFSIVSGSLPPGLVLDSGAGAISGTPTSAGTYTFTAKASDGNGLTGTATCTIIVKGPIPGGSYTTYTMGGWGARPAGHNPGKLLADNFGNVYGAAGVSIGGTYRLRFTSAPAIEAFLPQGSTAGILTGNATNPTGSAAGVFAGQVLALQLNVDFSNKGLTRLGLANLKVTRGPLAGQTVAQVLALANQVLGGNASVLPAGLTVTGLNDIVDAINNNFDGGASNDHYLQ